MRRTTTDFRTTPEGSGDIIRDALANAFHAGEKHRRSFHHGNEATCLVMALDRAGFEIVRKPEPAATVEALDRDEDLPGYGKAVRLLRGRLPSVVELADALGDASPDGPEGNVWKLRDRIDRGPPAGGFWAAPEGLPPEPAVKVGRVVVLDEAGERKLQDLLAGKSVPTGRIVEVTYRKPDGSTETHRHAEFAQIDSVSFDPPPVVGGEVAGARVLRATETMKLEPGKPAAAPAGVFDRDVQILGIFWADGIISFAGDAADMVAFRDMAAKVVGVPGSRDAA